MLSGGGWEERRGGVGGLVTWLEVDPDAQQMLSKDDEARANGSRDVREVGSQGGGEQLTERERLLRTGTPRRNRAQTGTRRFTYSLLHPRSPVRCYSYTYTD